MELIKTRENIRQQSNFQQKTSYKVQTLLKKCKQSK